MRTNSSRQATEAHAPGQRAAVAGARTPGVQPGEAPRAAAPGSDVPAAPALPRGAAGQRPWRAPAQRAAGRRAPFGAVRGVLPAALLALAAAGFCWKLLAGDLVVIGYDTMTYMYPYRLFAAAALRAGRLPLWNPYIYYGVPFLANLQSAVFYPLHALFLALPATAALNWSVAIHLFFAAYATYLAGRAVARLDPLAASVAGAIYGFGGFVGAQVGHLNQLNAAAWLPLALLTLHRALAGGGARWIAATAAVLAVQLAAGHAQESYMTLALLGSYVLFDSLWTARRASASIAARGTAAAARAVAYLRALARRLARAVAGLGLAGALAGAIGAAQLLPTAELTGHSIRAGGMPLGEAVSFSLPPRELFVGLLPTFGLASPSSNEYIGWVGVAGLMLALLGVLFRARHRPTLFFALLGAGSFLLALGNHAPFFELAFRVPGMSLFRVPARWLLLTSFALAMLAGSGLTFLARLGRQGWPRPGTEPEDAGAVLAGPWQRLGGATRLLAGVVVAGGAALALWPLQQVNAGDQAAQLLGTWLALGAGAVGLTFWSLAAAPSRWPPLAFALWVGVELFAASRSLEYNNPTPTAVYTAPRPVLDALWRDPRPERVLSIAATGYHPSDADQLVGPYQARLGPNGVLATLINTKYKETLNPNLAMAYRLPSVDGYDGGVLPLRRYVEYKRLLVPPETNLPDALLRDQVAQVPPLAELRLFGIKYVVDDAIGDVTRDGVFYDLGGSLALAPGESVRLLPGGAAWIETQAAAVGPVASVGIVTSLDGAAAVPDGAPVAAVVLGQDDAAATRLELVAGRDTAEGRYSAAARHRQPAPFGPAGGAGTATAAPGGAQPATYLARLPLPEQRVVAWVAIQSLLPAGRLRVAGLTLVGAEAAPNAAGQASPPAASLRQWPVAIAGGGAVRLVHRSDVKLYRTEDWLPRAYVAPEARVAAGVAEALALLSEADHDPARTVVLEADPGPPPASGSRARALLKGWRDTAADWLGVRRDARAGTVPADFRLQPEADPAVAGRGTPAASSAVPPAASGGGAGRVAWEHETAERLSLRVDADQPSILVVRDTLYPGWTATVDGRPVPILRADLLFRGIPLDAGTHAVELHYRSRALERGLRISSAGVVLTLALALAPARWQRALAGAARPAARAQ